MTEQTSAVDAPTTAEVDPSGSSPVAHDGHHATDKIHARVVAEPKKRKSPHLRSKRKKKFKRNRHKRTKVAVFRYSFYDPAFKYFVEQVLDCEYLALPEATKRSLELGSQNSNDYVCTPFKHILGDYIEALELGADILIQVGGPCRLGYYGELQESILRDMGYDFTMLNFSHGIEQGYIGWAKEVLKLVNPDLSIPVGIRQLLATGDMMAKLDSAHDYLLANAGFEVEKGAFERTWKSLLEAMRTCKTDHDISQVYREYMDRLRAIPLDKPANPLRIGVVGEYYTTMDEHSNLGLEKRLMSMGVELHRLLNFTNRFTRYNEPNLRRSAPEYLEYDMGPTSTMTVVAAVRYAQAGFDGVVHLKSAGCTPEIDCMPVLQRISEDYKMPILYLTYDSQTSDTGLDTRLEAFYDMMAMKKERRHL